MQRHPLGAGYRPAVEARSKGPASAAPLGAVAVLIRSAGTSKHRFAHTGGTRIALMQACSYNSQQPNSNGVDCVIDGGSPWTIDTNTGINTTPTVPVELQSFSVH